MKKPKKIYLVSDIESDIESDDDPQSSSQSIVQAANKVLDFNVLKKDQEKKLKEFKEKEKKNTLMTAKKISQKYENLKKTKKTYLVNGEDLETIQYDNDPQEDLFKGESVIEAANKVLDFDEFKKQQESAINNFNKNKRKAIEEVKIADIIKVPKKRKQQKDKAALIAAKKISKKYKNIRFR